MTPPRSRFASASVPQHLARGGGGLLALLAAPALLHVGGPLGLLGSLGAIGLGVVLLRGCPMCWFIGLIEVVAWRATALQPRWPRGNTRDSHRPPRT